ncbi:NADH-quinone oxidoreductase subunit C [Kitasatospora griseola]|uniref:NADH-quinone oxidoreductase subunit C n=1 Tax=Kitasatospora griseola TaxID=2064 RepID=UPI003415B70F
MTENPGVPTAAERTAAAIGPWATAAEAYELLTVTVPAEHWIEALTAARDVLGLAFLDWLSAVDELAEGFVVCAHLAAVGEPGSVRRLLLRTRVPRDKAVLPTAVEVYAGAAWHERETREMFGIEFPGHPYPATLLLPDGFEGHPLRKDFVLAARVAKDWPGAKEPGESDHGGGPARRKMLPPGVPDPNEWGPLKGTLPPVAERPARAARAGAGAGVDRPRRTRTVGEGSTSQATTPPATTPAADAPPVRADRPRRSRSVGEGSVSQAAPETPRRTTRTQSSDAPWHAPVPAHETPAGAKPETEKPAAAAAEAVKSEAAGPDVARPETVKPEAAESKPAAAESVKPGPAKSDAAEPEPAEPESAQAEPAKSDTAQPEPAQPESESAQPESEPSEPDQQTSQPSQNGDSA